MKKKTKNTFSKAYNYVASLIKKAATIVSQPSMCILPGQLAFSIILSLVPTITLIGYGASFFDISMDTIIEILKANFSDSIVNTLVPIISGNTLDISIIVVLIFMFYFSSNGPAAIIYASNEICGAKHSSWIKRRLKALAMVLLIVILYLFILLVPTFGERIVNAIDYFNIKSILSSLLSAMQGPISWIIIFIFIKLIYTLAPNKRIESASINRASLFTTIGWIITTSIYSYYISHFARYDLFYAGLSNIMVLMLWVYFLSYIFVVGLALMTKLSTKELEKTGTITIDK